jgi:mannose-6-phosphate isomerase-like protein (cupin superfamily)
MRMKRTALVVAVCLLVVGAGVVGAAVATPGSGIAAGPIVARGIAGQSIVLGTPSSTTVTRTVKVKVGRKTVTKRVSVTVPTVKPLMSCGGAASCDLAFQQLTINPGGYTGWHTHPGPTFVAVAQGEGTLYQDASACPSNKYAANSGFFQPSSEIHNFRNEGSAPLTVFAFYMLPSGTANTAIRTDQAQPSSCANIP